MPALKVRGGGPWGKCGNRRVQESEASGIDCDVMGFGCLGSDEGVNTEGVSTRWLGSVHVSCV